jgi:phosphatidylserine synthase
VGFLKSTPVAILLLVFSVLRVGEASHPGPAADDHNFFGGLPILRGCVAKLLMLWSTWPMGLFGPSVRHI